MEHQAYTRLTMTANVVAFLKKIAASPELQQKLDDIKMLPLEERQASLLALSREQKTPFSLDDLKSLDDSTEISEVELDQVVGGRKKVVTALGSYVHHEEGATPPPQEPIDNKWKSTWREFLTHFGINL